MHGDLARERRKHILVARRFKRHDHGDLAEAVGDLALHITADDAVARRPSGGAAQRQVLADGGDGVGDGVGDRAAAGIGLRAELRDIGLAGL